MKLGRLSLVAVMALGTSAFAIDNVKVNGEAKLWYQTAETLDNTATAIDESKLNFFEGNYNNGKGANTAAEVRVTVGATADLLPNLSAGVKASALTTLGLENNLVGAVPTAKFDNAGVSAGAAQLNDQSWVEEAYLAYTAGKTTAKLGRQALSTPLAFSEDWNVVSNTFEAAVLLNNDLPDTTLVGAWVGKHNGVGLLQPSVSGVDHGRNTTMAYNGEFSTFGTNGAYAAGAINKSLPNTTVQGWYYDVVQIAQAYWLQADAKVLDMIDLGVQYAGMSPAHGGKSNNALAIKGAVDVSGVNLYAAYSTVSEGTLGFANVATGDKTSLYTGLGSVYFDGEIAAAPDTNAWKVGASTKLVPGFTFAASYAAAETGDNGGHARPYAGASKSGYDYTAWDLIAKTKAGPVDLTAIYTEFTAEDAAGVTKTDNSLVRFIASLKF